MKTSGFLSMVGHVVFFSLVFSINLHAQQDNTGNSSNERMYSIEMENGNTVTGIIIKRNREEVVVKTGSGDTLNIEMNSIKVMREINTSYSNDLPQAPKQSGNESNSRKSFHTDFKKNLVAINLLDAAFQNFSISYERFIFKGYLGIKCPMSIGAKKDGVGNSLPENRMMSIGFDLNYYPVGQGIVSFFIGLGYEIGRYSYQIESSNSIKVSEAEPLDISYTSWYFNNGFMGQITKRVTISLLVGYGFRVDQKSDYLNYYAVPEGTYHNAWNFGINVGYRF